MNPFYLFLLISATLSVPIFGVTYQKASPAQRRQMVFAAIGAVGIAATAMLLLYFR